MIRQWQQFVGSVWDILDERKMRDRRWERNRQTALREQAKIGYANAQDKERFLRLLHYYQSR